MTVVMKNGQTEDHLNIECSDLCFVCVKLITIHVTWRGAITHIVLFKHACTLLRALHVII